MSATSARREDDRPDLIVLIDATGGDLYESEQGWGARFGVASEIDIDDSAPVVRDADEARFEARHLRFHDLLRTTSTGRADRRIGVQTWNDYDAEYADAKDGQAPYSQPAWFDAENRGTREADGQGRVALPASFRRLVDSEDGRYAIAQVVQPIELGASFAPEPEIEDESSGAGPPDGPAENATAADVFEIGAVLQWDPWTGEFVPYESVPRDSAADERFPPKQLQTRPRGAVGARNKPGGYVVTEDDRSPSGVRVGLWGTVVDPRGALGSYHTGREGTPIGPLPIRHDAQFAMRGLAGRVKFVSDDASEITENWDGELVKGEMWHDSSLANTDTAIGFESGQWRPVLRVTADLPPRKPPPWRWPPQPPKPPKDDEDDPGEEDEDGGPPEPPAVPESGRGEGSGGSRGDPPPPDGGGDSRRGVIHSPELTPTGDDIPQPPRRRPGRVPIGSRPVTGGLIGPGSPAINDDGVVIGGYPGTFVPVFGPGQQGRNYEGRGVPCPNATAGVIHGTSRPGPTSGGGGGKASGAPTTRGYPAVTPTTQGLVVGGFAPFSGTDLPLPAGGDISSGAGAQVATGGGGDLAGLSDLLRSGPVDPGAIKELTQGQLQDLLEDERIPTGHLPPYLRNRARFQRRRRRNREERARSRSSRQSLRDQFEDRQAQRQQQRQEQDRARRQRRREGSREGRRNRQDSDSANREQELRDALQRQRDLGGVDKILDLERKLAEELNRRQRREERRQSRDEQRRRRDEQRRRRRARARGLDPDTGEPVDRPPVQGGYILPVDDPTGSVTGTGARLPVARFGDYNVANAPMPQFGEPGAPRSVEDMLRYVSFALEATRGVVNGAFGGPAYLESNIGLVHRNGPGRSPAGSRIGAHWHANPGEELVLERGVCPLELVSVLEGRGGGSVAGRSGGVVEIVRETRGDVRDSRPLLLLEDRIGSGGVVTGDKITDLKRRFVVDVSSAATASKLRAHRAAGDQIGHTLEVGLIDPNTGVVLDTDVHVHPSDGVLVVTKGHQVTGGDLEVFGGGSMVLHSPTTVPADGEGAVAGPGWVLRHGNALLKELIVELRDSSGVAVSSPRVTMNETGVTIDAVKTTITGRLDPKDYEFTDLLGAATFIPLATAGLEYDSAVNARPLWQEAGSKTQRPLAYLSDVIGGGGGSGGLRSLECMPTEVKYAAGAPPAAQQLVVWSGIGSGARPAVPAGGSWDVYSVIEDMFPGAGGRTISAHRIDDTGAPSTDGYCRLYLEIPSGATGWLTEGISIQTRALATDVTGMTFFLRVINPATGTELAGAAIRTAIAFGGAEASYVKLAITGAALSSIVAGDGLYVDYGVRGPEGSYSALFTDLVLGWTSIAVALTSVLVDGTALVNATTGNDSTGSIGDLALPFKTIQAALTAMAVGDVALLAPGTHTISAVLVNAGGKTIKALGSPKDTIVNYTAAVAGPFCTWTGGEQWEGLTINHLGAVATTLIRSTATSNADGQLRNCRLVGTQRTLFEDQGTSVAAKGHYLLDGVEIAGGTLTPVLKQGAGTSRYRHVVVTNSGTALRQTSGTLDLRGCHLEGPFGSSIEGASTILERDQSTTFSTPLVFAAGAAVDSVIEIPALRDVGARVARATASTVTIGDAGVLSSVASSLDQIALKWSGVLTADVTAAGANGLDAGLETVDAWYAIHVIGTRSGAQGTASLLSLSSTVPTLPAGYDVFRHVGWARNNAAGNFVKFTDSGAPGRRRIDYMSSWGSRRLLVGGGLVGPTAVDLSSLVPPGVEIAHLHVDNNSAGGQRAGIRQSVGTPRLARVRSGSQIETRIPTDSAQSIAYDMTAVGGSLTIVVEGYEIFA